MDVGAQRRRQGVSRLCRAFNCTIAALLISWMTALPIGWIKASKSERTFWTSNLASPPIHLLVVEDQELVRSVIVHALTGAGFEVSSTGAADQALRLLDASGSRYGALITDINLEASLSGLEIAKHARAINPDLPILYIAVAVPREFAAEAVANSAILRKPFTSEELTEIVLELVG